MFPLNKHNQLPETFVCFTMSKFREASSQKVYLDTAAKPILSLVSVNVSKCSHQFHKVFVFNLSPLPAQVFVFFSFHLRILFLYMAHHNGSVYGSQNMAGQIKPLLNYTIKTYVFLLFVYNLLFFSQMKKKKKMKTDYCQKWIYL